MNINENEIIKNLYELIKQIKISIINNINDSYLEITKDKQYISMDEIEKWRKSILINISTEIDKLFDYNLENKEMDKINDNIVKKECKIEIETKLNNFIPKDIQEENKEITRNFQNEAYNYMNTVEKVENENVSTFLKEVGKLSRISYIQGKKLLKIMEEKYLKLKGSKILFDEDSKKEFSCWIKNLETEKGKKEYENILNQVNLFEKDKDKKEQQFLLKLFYDLTIMYFHCNISFPLVEICFKKEDNFNSDKMIDFINRGKNRKVNFVILPSLISNGSFLQNGKSWVFTYFKNTFKFEDLINDSLNNLIEQENLKDNLTIQVICKSKNDYIYVSITTNIDIPKSIEYEFIFYIINKNTNKNKKIKTKKKNFKLNKSDEIMKYEFSLENNTIISSSNIKAEH